MPISTRAHLQCWSLHINQRPLLGTVNDFNGNGTSDLAVFRPSTRPVVHQRRGQPAVRPAGDVPVSGDYDGNGVADVAVYRPATCQWFVSGGAPGIIQFGRTGDLPVPADYNGDKKTDAAVYRTTDGGIGVWFFNLPGQPPIAWGVRGDVPMPGDYDGDGRRRSRALPAGDRPVVHRLRRQRLHDQQCHHVGPARRHPGCAPTSTTTTSWISWSSARRPVRGTWSRQTPRRAPYRSGCRATSRWASISTATASPSSASGARPRARGSSATTMPPITITAPFGLPGDIPVGARPRLPSVPVSDFDGDGLSDITVFRPSARHVVHALLGLGLRRPPRRRRSA